MADIRPFPSRPGSDGPKSGGPGPAFTDVGDHAADAVLGRLREALPRPSRWILGPLVILSMAQMVLVSPWLVGLDPWGLLGSTSDGHVTRDGTLGLVVAAAGLVVAGRPRWAAPVFLLAGLAVVVQAVTGLFDVVEVDSGSGSTLAGEVIHLPSILIVCLIGLAAMPLRSLGPVRT